MAKGLTEEQLRRPPAAGEWSVHELLAHLRGAADVQGGWIARMLDEDGPTIRYASARTGMKKTGFDTVDFGPFFADYTRRRADLVATLSSLAPEDWSRAATFTGVKGGWSPTVLELARGIAGHEHAHFDQIQETAASVGRYQA